jgi:hypothetical protein
MCIMDIMSVASRLFEARRHRLFKCRVISA